MGSAAAGADSTVESVVAADVAIPASTPGQIASAAEAPPAAEPSGAAEWSASLPEDPVAPLLPGVEAAASRLHAAGCVCSACAAPAPEDGLAGGGGSAGGSVSAASLGTLDQLADYLATEFWTDRGSTARQFNLEASGLGANNGVLTYNTTANSQDADGLTPARATLVDEAFKLLEATLGIDFQQTSASGADLRFGDDQSGAYASSSRFWASPTTIASSAINVAAGWHGGGSTFGDYVFQTILHEIGHGLGLGHQGAYNGSGTYATDADFTNDSWQVSMMSYFDQTDNTSIDASFAYLSTPMVADWIALDGLYGAQGYGLSNAFLGDTTYGFNTTITAATSSIFSELKDWIPTTAFTVVDGGGSDTLDLSGFSGTQLIDLRPSDAASTTVYASNIAGKTGNLTFAPGTLIEAVIGGSGADTFRGNSANNHFDGGEGTDTLLVSGTFSDYSLSLSGSSLVLRDQRSGSPDGTDTLTNVEVVDFSGDSRSWAALLSLVGGSGSGSSGSGSAGSGSAGGGGGSGGGGASTVVPLVGGGGATAPVLTLVGTPGDDRLEGASDQALAETLEGGEGADRLVGYRGADQLAGGAGDDELRAGNGMDLIDGGEGADQLYGGFGTNRFVSSRDGAVDVLHFKSDQLAYNYLYDSAGNNPNGLKADAIEGLDAHDQVRVQGARTDQLQWREVVAVETHGGTLSGIGLYADGFLEAVYTGGDLRAEQLQQLTLGVEA